MNFSRLGAELHEPEFSDECGKVAVISANYLCNYFVLQNLPSGVSWASTSDRSVQLGRGWRKKKGLAKIIPISST